MAPKPPVIGAAASDAQAAVSVCWYIPAGKDTPVEPPPEGARLPSGSTTIGPWLVVSKCPLSRGPTKRTERPGHPQTLLLRFPPAGRSPPLQPVPFCHFCAPAVFGGKCQNTIPCNPCAATVSRNAKEWSGTPQNTLKGKYKGKLFPVQQVIQRILQGLILGHNAHNAAGYVPVRAQLHSLHSPALRRPPVNPTDAHGL